MRNYDITQISDLPSYLQITLNAMESEEDDIVLQGVEFWSSVCDEEIELQIEAAEAQETNTNPSTYSRHYAKGALQFIVPILLPILTKQEEHDDEEGWTPHKAAGVCLMLLASCCPKDIVPSQQICKVRTGKREMRLSWHLVRTFHFMNNFSSELGFLYYLVTPVTSITNKI